MARLVGIERCDLLMRDMRAAKIKFSVRPLNHGADSVRPSPRFRSKTFLERCQPLIQVTVLEQRRLQRQGWAERPRHVCRTRPRQSCPRSAQIPSARR
jgi:hypothetical protein